jgi:chromosome segregation ATPase
MSPDSPESRIGRLEQTRAALKQQVDDIADDVRMFYPLVAGQDVIRERLDRLARDLEAVTHAVADLRHTMEADKRDRERVRAEVGAVALVFTAVSSTVAVIALVVQ